MFINFVWEKNKFDPTSPTWPNWLFNFWTCKWKYSHISFSNLAVNSWNGGFRQVQNLKSRFGQVGLVGSKLFFSQTKFMNIWSHTRKARVNRGVHDAHFYKSMRVVAKNCRFTNSQPKLLKEMWLYFYLQVQNFKLSQKVFISSFGPKIPIFEF